ncbi:MAG: ABC transporter permease [Chloroflexi bacterium]|nr:ABC transporter permease [Chloroflexota bacterium]
MQRSKLWARLKSWEALLFIILCVVIFVNLRLSSHYLDLNNLANIFHLSIEKSLMVLIMAFVIINGEIDLSVASIMALGATVLAERYEAGWSIAAGLALALLVGLGCGLLNGLFVAYMGIPSLIVTLAGQIGYRGAARIILEDRSVGDFPKWFTSLGQDGFIGPFPITSFLFLALFILGLVVLQYSVFGRYVYAIGNNRAAAEYAGINAKQVKVTLFMLSGLIAALAGACYAARLGNVRANAAEGFELDVITIVLLGGVSIFGGTGTMLGVGLSLLVVLNLRNGMSLSNVDGNTQTSVVGSLLILSVLIPNWMQRLQRLLSHLFAKNPKLFNRGGAAEPKSPVSVHQ